MRRDHQQFDAAIRWAERAFSISSKRDAYHRAEAKFIMAVNARRVGELERASALFSDAAGLVEEGDVNSDEHLLALSWQIRFARTLLDHRARDGYPEIALARLDELEDEAVEQGVAARVGTDLDLHEARLKLQRGELQMLVGTYEEAQESFESSFTLLGWENSSEKALACSGMIHAAIFRGSFQVAVEHMRELQRYLRVAPESRVAWRYWQFACEMNLLLKLRLLDIPVEDSARTAEHQLLTMTEQGTFRVEMINAMLTLGSAALARDPTEALDLFSEAEILADARPVAKPPMREGKPTGALPDRLRLERTHALLGQADAHRLKGELDKAASMFQKTRRFYTPRAIRWGIERAELGIWLCARKESPPFQTDSVGAALVELIIADPTSELPIFLCTP
jgi:tetratricopeptide (TPR) repeat protein